MKNFTNNFKQFTSRLSARWLIMALMLLVGTSSAWAATITSDGTARLYFNMSAVNWWIASSGNNNFAYFFNSSSNAWSAHAVNYSGNTYYVTIPKGSWTTVILTRNNTTTAPSWNNKWNQTGNITLSSTSNYIEKFSENSTSVTWGTAVKPASTASLTANPATVNVGIESTLTANLSSNTGINTKSTVSYSVSPNTATVSSDKFKATAEGTYTVTATVTYHPNGYSSLTSTTTASATITVEDPCTLPTSISIDGEATPCAGSSQTYTATLDEGSGYTSSWTVPSGYTINSGSATTSATIKVGTVAGKITYTATCSSSSKISKDFDVAPINIVGPTISISNDGWTCPGANATITVTNAVLDGTYTYTLFNDENVQKGEVVKPTSGNVTFTVSTEDTYYVKATNACESKNSGNVKLNNYSTPENPSVKITAPTKCQGVASNNGVINMKNPVVGVTYTLTKDGTTYTRRNDEWISLGPGTYTLTANLDACSGLSDSWDIELTAEDITPEVETLTMPANFSSCDGQLVQGITLQNWNEADGYDYTYQWQSSSNGTTFSNMNGMTSSSMTPLLNGTTWYRVKVTKSKGGCTSPENISNEVKVTALPVSKPAVSINSVVYNSAADKFAFSGTLDDAGCATDIEVGYQYRLKGNVDWSTLTEADEVSGNEFSAEISIANTIVDQVYEFQAYATNSAGTTYSSIFEVTISAAENCETSNADYIEILCTNPSAAAGAKNSMYLYAWEMVNDVNIDLNGAFPGNKTSEGDFEYKGIKYASWHLKADKASIIFNNGDGNTQTNDITNLEKGKRYVYNYNPTAAKENRYTQVEDPSLIFAPEVETVSVSYKKVSGGLSVTFTGRINKKGCTTVSWYGYQSSTDDWGNAKNVMVGKTDVDAGTTFTRDTLLTAYGNYSFRARLINANSSKVYGEKVNITYTESDVVIAAVGNDENVTTNTSVYYDFVGLYVKSVMLPSSTDKIESYQWQVKNGSSWETYNGGIVTVADRGVSAASNNIRPNTTGTYRCLVKIKNNNTPLVSNEITITADASYSTSKSVITTSNRSLPVISVRTNEAFPGCSDNSKTPSAQTDHYKAKRSVDVKIFDKDGNLYYDRKARMNYRGSSSLNFKKKSYAFCTGDENCGQDEDKSADYVKTKKMNLFGLSDGAKDKDWVLYAAAADPSFMRNRLAFDTYKEMTGEWGVSSMYVELIIDGDYKGVYVLMDKVTVNKDRVNITASNGFLVKYDKTDKEDRVEGYDGEYGDQKTFKTTRTGGDDKSTYDTTNDQRFEIEYPEKKDVVEDGGNWNATVTTIKNMFEDFEEALSTKDYPRVRQLIDYKSWADWFIFNEFSKNVDAYRASCIFVYNGDKIEARPLWDQELSFKNKAPYSVYHSGDENYKSTDQTNGLLIRNAKVYTDGFPAPFWFTGGDSYLTGGLLGDACFISVLRDRWDLHTGNGGALTAAKMQEKVAAYVDELGTAYSRDYTKWKEGNYGAERTIDCKGGGVGYVEYSFTNSKTDLDNWIAGDIKDLSAESSSENRRSNLNYIIEKELEAEEIKIILTLSPEDGKTTPWIPVSVKVSAPKGYEYTYDESSILSVTGDDAPTRNAKGNVYTYTFPRPKDWGAGNVSPAIVPNEYNVSATLKMAGGTNECGSTIQLTTEATITLEDEGNDNCQ